MIVKDLIEVITSEYYPDVRILITKNGNLEEKYHGQALNTPYRFLESKISSVHAYSGNFEILLEGCEQK